MTGIVNLPPDWPTVVDGIESIVTIVAVILAGLYAIFGDWRRSKDEREQDRQLQRREQQQRDDTLAQQERQLRWDQARIAREINDQFLEDPDAQAVLGLIDCDAGTYEVIELPTRRRHEYNLAAKEHIHALRIPGLPPSDKEVHLREGFDAWFYWMALMEQYLKNKLVLQQDIDYPSNYYLRCLAEDQELLAACRQYIEHYRLGTHVTDFMCRFGVPAANSAHPSPNIA